MGCKPCGNSGEVRVVDRTEIYDPDGNKTGEFVVRRESKTCEKCGGSGESGD